jgi:hypothetical protein
MIGLGLEEEDFGPRDFDLMVVCFVPIFWPGEGCLTGRGNIDELARSNGFT